MPPSSPPIPLKLHLDRERHLDITWPDGQRSLYPLTYLRTQCPCASCKESRATQEAGSAVRTSPTTTRLTLLSAPPPDRITALAADLVGNYALRIEWSDAHASGIYSFEYLYSIRQG